MSREDKHEINFGPITLNINLSPPERDELLFDFGPEFTPPDSKRVHKSLKGFSVAYNLKDNKGLKLKLSGKSKHGNPVDFSQENIEVKSSDETILTVTETAGEITILPVGMLGTAQVQVTLPDVVVAGAPLAGDFEITVIAGDAATIAFEPEETFEEPDAPVVDPTPPAPPVEPTA